MNRSAVAIAVAACTLELTAAPVLQILPASDFRTRDGRPHGLPAFRIDAAIAAKLIERMHARKIHTVIDYEHQTLYADANGQPAPAAGWFKTVEWRAGKGLFATDIEWTARAKQMIEAKEYLYFSPVIAYDKRTGEVLHVELGAITNTPAIEGMDDLVLRAAARFLDDSQENEMSELLKNLLTALNLPAATSEADALAGVAALKVKADKTGALETEVTALKARTPDPAQYVPVSAMKEIQTQVATLSATLAQRDLDEIVTAALTDGKLLPAQEKWARDLGKSNLEALKSFIASAQAIPALRRTQTGGRGPEAALAGDPVAAAKQEFASNAALREEFIDEATYVAWRKADSEGRVKVLGRTAH